jgi:hypothetical protein
MALSSAMKLFGTKDPAPKRRIVSAGALSAIFENGALRTIRMREVQVIRMIAFWRTLKGGPHSCFRGKGPFLQWRSLWICFEDPAFGLSRRHHIGCLRDYACRDGLALTLLAAVTFLPCAM